jgi:hypothetical protein
MDSLLFRSSVDGGGRPRFAGNPRKVWTSTTQGIPALVQQDMQGIPACLGRSGGAGNPRVPRTKEGRESPLSHSLFLYRESLHRALHCKRSSWDEWAVTDGRGGTGLSPGFVPPAALRGRPRGERLDIVPLHVFTNLGDFKLFLMKKSKMERWVRRKHF